MKLCKQCQRPVPYLGRRDLIDVLFEALEPLVRSAAITAAARGQEMHDDADDVRRDACVLAEVTLSQAIARVHGCCISCVPLDEREQRVRQLLETHRASNAPRLYPRWLAQEAGK